mgnify:CR=1 FL=1
MKSNHCKECGGKHSGKGYCINCYNRAQYRVNKGGSWADPNIATHKA